MIYTDVVRKPVWLKQYTSGVDGSYSVIIPLRYSIQSLRSSSRVSFMSELLSAAKDHTNSPGDYSNPRSSTHLLTHRPKCYFPYQVRPALTLFSALNS